MASLVILKNPLSVRDKEHHLLPPGSSVIDWLVKHHPNGFGVPMRWFLGDSEQPLTHLDLVPEDDDVVVIMLCPAGIEIALGALITNLLVAVLTSAIVSAVSYFLFSKPKVPGFADQESQSSVYDISSQQNAARTGEPVPVIYGNVLTTPDYCAQPYTFFGPRFTMSTAGTQTLNPTFGQTQSQSYSVDYTTNPITPEYFDNLHDVTTGWLEVVYADASGNRKTREHMYSQKGEFPTKYGTRGSLRATETQVVNGITITSNVFEFTSYPSLFDLVVPLGDMYLDLLMCVGQGEVDINDVLVGDTSWLDYGGAAVQYTLLPPDVHQQAQGNLGFLFNGTFRENQISSPEVGDQELVDDFDQHGWFGFGKGEIEAEAIEIDVQLPAGIRSVTGGGADELAEVRLEIYLRRVDANGLPIGGTTRLNTEVIRNNTPEVVRMTFRYDNLTGTGWQFLARRIAPTLSMTDPADNPLTLAAARLQVAPTAGTVYGDVTLMAVRIKAINGIGGNAQSRVRVDCTRRVENYISNPGALIATASPADAFADIYANPIYGAGRPVSELDTGKLAALKSWWFTYEFNAVFQGRSSIFEALAASVQGCAAEPLPIGSLMSVNHQGTKNVRSMLFSPNNISAGTFSIDYQFDPAGSADGIECQYVNAKTFAPAFTRFPVDSVQPEKINLFGCTDATHADQFAKMVWLQKLNQRKIVSFDTELEGLIPLLGERIAVAHQMPDWSQSGEITEWRAAYDGYALKPDALLDWSAGAGNHTIILRNSNGKPSDPIPCWWASEPDIVGQIWVPSLPGFEIITGGDQERTFFALASTVSEVKDFILTSINPRGGLTVGIEGVVYSEAPFQDTLDFLDTELPYDPANPFDPAWDDTNPIVFADVWDE